MLTCNLPFVFLFFLSVFVSLSRSQLFRNDHCREVFEKLNCKSKIWAKRSIILDEVDPTIRANLES